MLFHGKMLRAQAVAGQVPWSFVPMVAATTCRAASGQVVGADNCCFATSALTPPETMVAAPADISNRYQPAETLTC
jgi:hypothetical protein